MIFDKGIFLAKKKYILIDNNNPNKSKYRFDGLTIINIYQRTYNIDNIHYNEKHPQK
jgi:hypothetical protein